MHRGLPLVLIASLLGAAGAQGQQLASAVPDSPGPVTTLDVAPTTLDLKPGVAGLFYVTNHGAHAVTVQIEAMDWQQGDGRDRLAPSRLLLTSPPMARIAPGGRQSVRVLARVDAGHEHAFRLLVSQLPDAAGESDGVHVLLQFSVPVFAGHDFTAQPRLRWLERDGALIAVNDGSQTVKLEALRVNGDFRGGLTYLLPGAARNLGTATPGAQIAVHEGRTNRDLSGTVIQADSADAPW